MKESLGKYVIASILILLLGFFFAFYSLKSQKRIPIVISVKQKTTVFLQKKKLLGHFVKKQRKFFYLRLRPGTYTFAFQHRAMAVERVFLFRDADWKMRKVLYLTENNNSMNQTWKRIK